MAAKLTQFDLDTFETEILSGHATHFSAVLVRLIRKSDEEEMRRLARIYPQHVIASALFDAAPRGSRMWRCGRCDGLNTRPADWPHPGMCGSCHQNTEPPLPPRLPEPTSEHAPWAPITDIPLRFWFYGTVDQKWDWRQIAQAGFMSSLLSLGHWQARQNIPREFDGCALLVSIGKPPPTIADLENEVPHANV